MALTNARLLKYDFPVHGYVLGPKSNFGGFFYFGLRPDLGSLVDHYLKPGNLKMAFFSAQCRLDGACSV